MIIRRGTAALRTPPAACSSCHHLHRSLFTTSPAGAIKDERRGSRITRVARQHPGRKGEEHEEPPTLATPPWPTTSPPDPNIKYPWASYNHGPPSPAPSSLPPEAITAPSSVIPAEVDTGLQVASIPVSVRYDPEGVLDNAVGPWSDRARGLFSTQAIVVVRQLEMMNLFLGFEEANKYQLLSPEGYLLGYLMEEDLGFRSAMTRQILRTHRAFKATVLDAEGNVLLRIRRPFSWINSRIYISVPSPTSTTDSPSQEADESVIGEAQQEWHLYRRKYSHYVKRGDEMVQFAAMDSGLLAWDFYVRDEAGQIIGSVNRNFAGFGRELFTDTGQYVLRFEGVVQELSNPAIESLPAPDALPSPSSTSSTKDSPTTVAVKTTSEGEISSVPALLPVPSITFDQRAVMLASAVSIDFDYFSRQRGGIGAGAMWMPMPMGGTSGTDTGAGAEVPTEVGEVGNEGTSGPLPPSADSDYGGGEVNRDSGGWSESNRDSGGWGDEVMKDPWANQGEGAQQEDGGTWSWGDLFPDE